MFELRNFLGPGMLALSARLELHEQSVWEETGIRRQFWTSAATLREFLYDGILVDLKRSTYHSPTAVAYDL